MNKLDTRESSKVTSSQSTFHDEVLNYGQQQLYLYLTILTFIIPCSFKSL